MSREDSVHRSFVRYEPPDIAFWRFVGDLSEAELRRLLKELVRQAAGKQYLLQLVDLTRMGQLSPGARKAHNEKTPYDLRGTAFYGASARLRILANVTSIAWNVLSKRTDNPVRFFDTEAEARAWLDGRRHAIHGEPG